MPRSAPMDFPDDSEPRWVVPAAFLLIFWAGCKPAPVEPPRPVPSPVAATASPARRPDTARREEPPPPPRRAKAVEEPQIIDGLRIDVVDVRVLKERDGDLLRIVYAASTADATRSYQLRGWTSAGARVSDRFANKYQWRLPEAKWGLEKSDTDRLRDMAAKGILPRQYTFDVGQITSSHARVDDLYFDVPPPAVESLDLDLDGRGAGVTGVYRFTVPLRKSP